MLYVTITLTYFHNLCNISSISKEPLLNIYSANRPKCLCEYIIMQPLKCVLDYVWV